MLDYVLYVNFFTGKVTFGCLGFCLIMLMLVNVQRVLLAGLVSEIKDNDDCNKWKYVLCNFSFEGQTHQCCRRAEEITGGYRTNNKNFRR